MKPNQMKVAVLLLLLFWESCWALSILSPSYLSNMTFDTPIMGNVFRAVRGILVYVEYPCVVEANDPVATQIPNKIVLTTYHGCSSHEVVFNLQQLGAIGVVGNLELLPGLNTHAAPNFPLPSPLEIPAFDIGFFDYLTLLDIVVKQNITTEVFIDVDDFNPWTSVWNPDALAILTLYTFVTCSVVIGYGIYKLVIYLRHKKTFALPVLIVIVDILALLFRMISSIDPLAMRGFFSRMASDVLQSISLPLLLLSSISICFYWIDTVLIFSFKKKSIDNLSKTKIPFIIVGVLLLGYTIVINILTGMFFLNNFVLFTIQIVCFFVVSFLIGVFFIIVGALVLKRLNKLQGIQTRRRKIIRRTTAFIVVEGATLLSLVLLIGIGIQFAFYPLPAMIIVYLVGTVQTISIFFHFVLIHVKDTEGRSGKTETMNSLSIKTPPTANINSTNNNSNAEQN
jgi:hypothetical protein